MYLPWFASTSDKACGDFAFDQLAIGRPVSMLRYANGFSNVCKEVRT